MLSFGNRDDAEFSANAEISAESNRRSLAPQTPKAETFTVHARLARTESNAQKEMKRTNTLHNQLGCARTFARAHPADSALANATS
jgi:hypothetical protein